MCIRTLHSFLGLKSRPGLGFLLFRRGLMLLYCSSIWTSCQHWLGYSCHAPSEQRVQSLGRSQTRCFSALFDNLILSASRCFGDPSSRLSLSSQHWRIIRSKKVGLVHRMYTPSGSCICDTCPSFTILCLLARIGLFAGPLEFRLTCIHIQQHLVYIQHTHIQ